MPKRIVNKILNLLMILVVGGIGGILISQFLLPWLAQSSPFNKVGWIKQMSDGTTVINRTEQVIITENEGMENAVSQAKNVVVGVVSQRTERMVGSKKVLLEKPEILTEGAGFMASSDGLIITADSLAPESAQKILVVFDNKQVEAQVQKRDKTAGLVLLKVSENNLPVLAFREEDLQLGEQVFLIGADSKNSFNKFIEASIVSELGSDLAMNFFLKDINGSPVFDIKSEIVGINLVDSDSSLKTIPSSVIRALLK